MNSLVLPKAYTCIAFVSHIHTPLSRANASLRARMSGPPGPLHALHTRRPGRGGGHCLRLRHSEPAKIALARLPPQSHRPYITRVITRAASAERPTTPGIGFSPF